jgi:hypothetical protein
MLWRKKYRKDDSAAVWRREREKDLGTVDRAMQKRRALVFVRTSWSVHHVTWARVPERQWGPNGTVSFLALFAKRPLVPTTGWFGGPIESGDWLERQHVALIICNCGVLPFSTDTWALGFILIFNWAPRSGWTGDESDDGIWCSFCL